MTEFLLFSIIYTLNVPFEVKKIILFLFFVLTIALTTIEVAGKW